jgi:hypothetical protein
VRDRGHVAYLLDNVPTGHGFGSSILEPPSAVPGVRGMDDVRGMQNGDPSHAKTGASTCHEACSDDLRGINTCLGGVVGNHTPTHLGTLAQHVIGEDGESSPASPAASLPTDPPDDADLEFDRAEREAIQHEGSGPNA